MRRIIAEIIAIFIVVLVYACQTNRNCDTKESFVKIGFYNGDEKAVSVEDVSLYGLGREDSLLYENQTISSVLMPLSSAVDSASFIFIFGSFTDTITVSYQTNMRFESNQCGFMADYSIDTVYHTKNAIDSMAQVNRIITNENEEHYKIFFN